MNPYVQLQRSAYQLGVWIGERRAKRQELAELKRVNAEVERWAELDLDRRIHELQALAVKNSWVDTVILPCYLGMRRCRELQQQGILSTRRGWTNVGTSDGSSYRFPS